MMAIDWSFLLQQTTGTFPIAHLVRLVLCVFGHALFAQVLVTYWTMKADNATTRFCLTQISTVSSVFGSTVILAASTNIEKFIALATIVAIQLAATFAA
jgi:hypothetical protein